MADPIYNAEIPITPGIELPWLEGVVAAVVMTMNKPGLSFTSEVQLSAVHGAVQRLGITYEGVPAWFHTPTRDDYFFPIDEALGDALILTSGPMFGLTRCDVDDTILTMKDFANATLQALIGSATRRRFMVEYALPVAAN